MASTFSHAVAALSIGTCFYRRQISLAVVPIGAISVVLNTTVDLIVVGFAGLIAQRLARNPKFIERQRTGSGVGMIGLGIYVAASK
jgi:threonine/homoserine/homoserine lactone efflux protein